MKVKNELIRLSAVLSGGLIVSQIIQLLASPILTRIYSPEYFGLYSFFSSVIGIISVIVCLKIEAAIPLALDEDEARSLLGIATVISFIFSCLICVILIPFCMFYGLNLHGQDVNIFAFQSVMAAALVGLFSAISLYAIYTKRPAYVVRGRVIQAFLQVILQILFGLAGWQKYGLMNAFIIANVISVTYLWLSVGRSIFDSFENFRQNFIILSKKYKVFAYITAPSSLVNSVGILSPPLYFGLAFGVKEAAYYALAQRVVGLPVILLGQAFNQAFFVYASDVYRESKESFEKLFFKTLKLSFAVSVPAFLLIALFSPRLFQVVFGDQWVASGEYVSIMAPAFMLQFVCSTISQTSIITGANKLQAIWDIGRAVVIFCLFFVFHNFDLSAYQALLILIGNYFLFYMVQIFMNIKLVKSYRNKNFL